MPPRLGRPIDLLLVVALILAAFLLDLLFVPEELLGLLYAVPILVAALRLPPGATALAAAATLVLYGLSATLGHPQLIESAEHVLVHLLTLSLVAYLGYLLAARIQQAQHAQQLAQAAQRSLQSFLGMVAHDLRGPLTGILGYAQVAGRSQTPAELRARALATIEAEARRMDRLLADLVDAARLGAGSFQVHPKPTDLVALAQEVVQAQQATAAQQIVLEVPAELEGVWDPDRLGQVLTNLLSNAVKHGPAGERIVLRLASEDKQVVVSVADRGRGLSPQDLPRLFQPFSCLDNQARGAGLGLYIAQGIVQAHGGRIWATSPGPGQGATFTFALPLRSQGS